jgi:hypothetical protein
MQQLFNRLLAAMMHGSLIGRNGMAADRKPGTTRQERLAEQLRANLARRKEQTRSRRQGEADLRREGVAVEQRTPREGDAEDAAT